MQSYWPPCGSTISMQDCAIEYLYDLAPSTVQFNDSTGKWFRTKLELRKDVFFHPTSSTFFLERIMSDALKEYDLNIRIGGRDITKLRFTNGIEALADDEQELETLVESLDKTCTRYKMKINAEKTKLMTNTVSGFLGEIKVKRQRLGTVTSFKYLGAVVSDEGSKPEVHSRIEQVTAALTKLKPI